MLSLAPCPSFRSTTASTSNESFHSSSSSSNGRLLEPVNVNSECSVGCSPFHALLSLSISTFFSTLSLPNSSPQAVVLNLSLTLSYSNIRAKLTTGARHTGHKGRRPATTASAWRFPAQSGKQSEEKRGASNRAMVRIKRHQPGQNRGIWGSKGKQQWMRASFSRCNSVTLVVLKVAEK